MKALCIDSNHRYLTYINIYELGEICAELKYLIMNLKLNLYESNMHQ